MNAAALNEAAHRLGLMIATAESCTGGMVAAAITDIAGSSAVFDRGFVTYSNAAKTAMLGVDPALIDRHGAVSEEVARAMAEGALARSGATLAVSGSETDSGQAQALLSPSARPCAGRDEVRSNPHFLRVFFLQN